MKTRIRYEYHHQKSGKQVTLRPLDLALDLDCLHQWLNHAHTIPNWQLNKTKPELHQHFQQALADKHQALFILAIDGHELCYAELYYAPQDRLAAFCDLCPGDYGLHLLIGPPEAIGKGHSEALLCALTDYLFQYEGAARVLVEPNHQVAQFSILERKLGFSNLGPIKLPEKIATLYAATAQAFYTIPCDAQAWPLLRMHFPSYPSDQAVAKWLADLDHLLQRQQPCVVISTFSEHYQFPQTARRQQALWFKRNKDLLKAYCLGMVRVTKDTEMIAKITSNAMREGMPFACIPADDITSAEKIANDLLKQHYQGESWK